MTNIALTYDDITLVPKYSEIKSRHTVDLKTEVFRNKEGMKVILNEPFVGAPMDTVCGPDMCQALWGLGSIGVLHRYNTIDEQCEQYKSIIDSNSDCFVAIGATGDYLERAEQLFELGCRLFCIDVAHGNHVFVKNALFALRMRYGDSIHIMAGNVCDYSGAYNLTIWGADSIRCGVGGGSVCSTRIVTGHGVPNFTAILEARRGAERAAPISDRFKSCTILSRRSKPLIIADGGIRTSGDVAKALAAGANLIMIGSMIAGAEESPPVVAHRLAGHEGGFDTVEYRGMASAAAQKSNGRVSIVEGISAKIPYKGPVINVIINLRQGLQSALSYTGANNLSDFRKHAQWIQVTPAATIESKPHIK